jgi:hypothetical protein
MSGAEPPPAYEPDNLLDAISRQIAEDLVESCQATCRTPNPTLDAITSDPALHRILDNISNGKYVKFKSRLLRGAFLLFPNSAIIAGFRRRLDAHPDLRELIEDICRSQCNVETLHGITKHIIRVFGSADDVDKYFEMKNPSSGGRRGRRGGRRGGRGTAIVRRGTAIVRRGTAIVRRGRRTTRRRLHA